MWRRRDLDLVTHWSSRTLRTLGYLGLAGSGLAYLVTEPSPSLTAVIGYPMVVVWSWFLMVGGVLAASSGVTGRQVGEFLGLPLIVTALGVFAGCLLVLGTEDSIKFVLGVMFSALASAMLARMIDVHREHTALLRLSKGVDHAGR